MKNIILTISLTFLSIYSHAEIEKFAIPSESCGGMCFYWWPKLPNIQGWHHEREQSYNYSANAQAPDGFTFANAETVFYAKALYKLRIPETNNIEQLIKDDHSRFLSKSELHITQEKPIYTADNKHRHP